MITLGLRPIALAFAVMSVAVTTDPHRVGTCADTSNSHSSFEFANNPWLNLYNFLLTPI